MAKRSRLLASVACFSFVALGTAAQAVPKPTPVAFGPVARPAAQAVPKTAPESKPGVCSGPNLLLLGDPTGANPAECALRPGAILIESLYYQNASQVGGTALAAYPMLSIRAGVSPRFTAELNLPSQIAESGLAGAGLYPRSRGGVGINYAVAQDFRHMIAVDADVEAPDSLYAPNELTQPRYRVGASTIFALRHGAFLNASFALSSSEQVGFNRVHPMEKVGIALPLNPRTIVSIGLGNRVITRQASSQSFADVWVSRLLRRNLSFGVGLGTAFNAVQDTKAHYLAAGFDFNPSR
jgi:hypothetical protein